MCLILKKRNHNTKQKENYAIYGIEKRMAKGITAALNMQSWIDASEVSDPTQTLFLNLE